MGIHNSLYFYCELELLVQSSENRLVRIGIEALFLRQLAQGLTHSSQAYEDYARM
jgi:hypothetical protein